MKLRHTLGLLLLLLLLSGLYYGMQVLQLHREQEARIARRLFQVAPEDIRRISIDPIDGPTCVAERDGEARWRFLEPNPTIVPFHRMWERVSAALSMLMNEHTVLTQPADLGQYGLDMPALTITWESQDGDSHLLEFGDLEPTQRYRYARLEKGALFLVNTDAFYELNRSLLDLRHRFLVDDREAPLHEIEFAWIWAGGVDEDDEEGPDIGDESVVIKVMRESAQASWRMTEPAAAPANHEAVQALSDDIQFAVCNEFIDNPEDLDDYGLAPPRARISVKDSVGRRPQTIWIGALDTSPDRKGLFARREGEDAVMVLDGHILTLLPRSPLEWRDMRLMTRRVSDINRLEYRCDDDAFVLEKDGEGAWRLTSPKIEDVNEFAVSGYLRFFREVSGEELVAGDDARRALDAPVARIHLQYHDGATAEIALAPDPETPDVYWASQDTGGVVRLSRAAANMLLTSSDNFRSRELMRFIKADARDIRFSFEEMDYHLARRHGRWALLQPESAVLHNQADVDMLMDAVTPLNAAGLVLPHSPANPEAYGLAPPVFTITIEFAEDSAQRAQSPMTLEIGTPTPDNPSERFARSTMREGLFRIGQETMDEIREALRGIQ